MEIANNCNKILQDTEKRIVKVIEQNGELIEKGSHKELMEQRGKYFDLFTTQSKRYVSAERDDVPKKPMPFPLHNDRFEPNRI